VKDVNGSAHSVSTSLRLSVSKRIGYCIGNDQYFKRDDVGIIYQMNVVPDRQRGLIGAMLVKAMFDRAAYGCKLFCCWCAQDIGANHFWESLGFTPLAFRAGSREKGRVHIFWQRRIREGDTTTPYWFPSQTTSGSIREDRLVFPIPPGKRWSDEMPRILPADEAEKSEGSSPKQIADTRPQPGRKPVPQEPTRRFAQFGRMTLREEPAPAQVVKKPKAEKKPKRKNDPRLIAAARELRDRWLERVNADGLLPSSQGKYDVSRQLQAPQAHAEETPLLTAA
jgi:hypothetical protein